MTETTENENVDEYDKEYILEVDKIVLGYNGMPVTCEISFGISEGDFLCVTGDNGTGKSTLIKAVLGLMKPIEGHIFLYAPKNEIGYLPQQNEIQKDFPATNEEIVLTGTFNKSKWYKPFYSKEQKERAIWAFEKTNSLDIKNHCYSFLSGGQQQRVLLARALAAAKNMIILDEPTANLDPQATIDFFELLKKINKEENMTIVIVSHDHTHALKYATHILRIAKESCDFKATENESSEVRV